MSGTQDSSTLSPVKAKLKWFNKTKGFGFVIPEGMPNINAFLHITALLEANCQSLGENAEISCVIEEGPKGHIVKEIKEILFDGDPDTISPLNDGRSSGDFSDSETFEMNGEIKWYKPEKGFGFVVPDDGQKDIFLHKKCLDKLGLESIESGRKVHMIVRQVPKGREVVSFEFMD